MPDDKIFWQYLRAVSLFFSLGRFLSAEFTIGEVLLSRKHTQRPTPTLGARLTFDLLGLVQYIIEAKN